MSLPAPILRRYRQYLMLERAFSANTLDAFRDGKRQPHHKGDVMILSSPEIETGTTYILKTGVSVSGGIRFHNLYTTLPSVSGGTSTITNFATSSSNTVYTDSSVSSGFGGRP